MIAMTNTLIVTVTLKYNSYDYFCDGKHRQMEWTEEQ